MNETLAAALLGVVQGLTEFLPISSSGHLVLFQQFLPVSGDPVAFDLALHLGTLLPVFAVFRADLARVTRDLLAGEGPWWQRSGVRLATWVVLGSLPTAIIGLTFEDLFTELFSNPLSVGVAFAVTGLALFATRYAKLGDADERSMSPWAALAVGFVQGIAITPGISRSGSTIAAGLFLGLKREYAARYSFLLAIPAICGAVLLKARHLDVSGLSPVPLAVGFTTAAISGLGALLFLLRVVRAGDFSRFSWYLWALSVLAIGLALR